MNDDTRSAENAPGSEAENTPQTEAPESADTPKTPEEELEGLKLALAKAEDDRLRALAEVDNVRKRLQREAEEHRKYAGEAVLADLLPVLDNLDMALEYAPEDPAAKGFVDGVRMTRKIFLDILEGHGLSSLGEIEQAFDPEFHEAVGYEENGDMDEGRICKLVQKGYSLKGRLVRPAKVLVSKPC